VGVSVVEVGGELLEWLRGWGDAPGFELLACEFCGDEGEQSAVATVGRARGPFLDSLDGPVVELGERGELAGGEVGERGQDEDVQAFSLGLL
jgi:hypothetical protein